MPDKPLEQMDEDEVKTEIFKAVAPLILREEGYELAADFVDQGKIDDPENINADSLSQEQARYIQQLKRFANFMFDKHILNSISLGNSKLQYDIQYSETEKRSINRWASLPPVNQQDARRLFNVLGPPSKRCPDRDALLSITGIDPGKARSIQNAYGPLGMALTL